MTACKPGSAPDQCSVTSMGKLNLVPFIQKLTRQTDVWRGDHCPFASLQLAMGCLDQCVAMGQIYKPSDQCSRLIVLTNSLCLFVWSSWIDGLDSVSPTWRHRDVTMCVCVWRLTQCSRFNYVTQYTMDMRCWCMTRNGVSESEDFTTQYYCCTL